LSPACTRPVLGGVTLVVSAMACVSSEAGYQDVRRLTAERIQTDVRWQEHESASTGRQQTQKLLARPLDAASAVQLALLNNQDLQAAFEELGVARARLVQALALPNPSVDAALRYQAGESDSPSIELGASLDLSALVFLPLLGGAAGAELDAAKVSVAGATLDLAFQARVAFYEYQAAAQILELRQTILVALRASFEAAEQLHHAGNVTDLDLANERALYEESRVAYTAAESALAGRREELSALMGVFGADAAWATEGRLPDVAPGDPQLEEWKDLEERAIVRSLDLELGRRRFAAAAKGANVARARGWVPELRAGVSAERESDEGAEWGVGPAISLELPLFYQGQGQTGVALANMRREQKAYASTAVRIRATARAAAARLQAAARNASYYKDVLLPLRQQITNETQLQFNAMNIGVFQLLQAKRDQMEAARAYVELLREYWTARATADQLLAGRLPRGAATLGSSGADRSSAPGPGTNAEAH
jgi:outer membrane protein TolC